MHARKRTIWPAVASAALLLALSATPALAQDAAPASLLPPPPALPEGVEETSTTGVANADPVYIPNLSGLVPRADNRESLSGSLQIVVLLTLLTVAPSLLLMMTSFIRMLVVLTLLRQALGT